MHLYVYLSFNLSILLVGLISVIRFKTMSKAYYPFIYRTWAGCANELLSVILILNSFHTISNNNIYVLFESVLLTWFFKRMGLLGSGNKIFSAIVLFLSMVWLIEITLFTGLYKIATIFRIVYSLMIVMMSITLINKLFFSSRNSFNKNAAFLLCTTFIIYFSAKAVVQAFTIYGIDRQSEFLRNIYIIMIYLNLFINILHIIVVLWIPRKLKFSLPSL